MNSVVISNACGRMSGVFFGRPLHPQYLQLSFEFFIFSSLSCKQLIYIDLHLTNQMLQSPSCVREEEELEPVKWSCSGLGHI